MMIARLKRLADPVSSPLLKITDLVVKHTQLNKSSSLVKSVAGDKGLIAGAADKLVTKNLVDKQFSKTHQITEARSEEHTSELQSRPHLVCRLLLEKKKEK